jgi:6-pyruvoyl-tetrahydropterin synthase
MAEPLIVCTRRYGFQAVHRLVVGLHKERLHGHHYDLEVSLASGGDQILTGALEDLVESLVIDRLHGRDLTKIVNPATGENLVNWIDEKLRQEPRLACRLRAVALQETRKNRFVSAKSEARFV